MLKTIFDLKMKKPLLLYSRCSVPQDGGGKSTCHPPGHDKDGDADHAEDDPHGHGRDHVDGDAFYDYPDDDEDDALLADLDKMI